jgi:hypothetical protein
MKSLTKERLNLSYYLENKRKIESDGVVILMVGSITC